jgi:hypothetical protein
LAEDEEPNSLFDGTGDVMVAHLTPAEQIEQSYDHAMIALADYLARERDAEATIDRLLRILDRDSLGCNH